MEQPSPPPGIVPGRQTLLRIITALLVLGAFKISSVITFPLLFAAFLLFFVWPIQRRLEHYLPRALALVVSLSAVLLVTVLVAAALLYSGYLVTTTIPGHVQSIQNLYDKLTARAHALGLARDQGLVDLGAVIDQVTAFAAGVFTNFLTTSGFLLLVSTFLILGLLEVPRSRDRLYQALPESQARRVHEVVTEISHKLHEFMLVRTFTSALTAVLTGLLCWLVGLDLAFVWGFLAFMLNYIPTLGSIIAVIPPTLMALIQYNSFLDAFGVLLMLTVLQMVIGNYLDPRLQGRYLSISPLTVIFSLVFWGWIGGVPGAILGVPLTIGLIITANEFPSTRPIAALLADLRTRPQKPERNPGQPAG